MAEKNKEFDKKYFCVVCGNSKPEDQELCDVCQALVDETFHEFPDEMAARRYARDYLKKKLDHEEKQYIKDLYKENGKDSVIGVMPSQCPLCFRLSKGAGEFIVFKKDSKEYKKHIVNKEKLSVICSPCGNLAHFLKEFYELDADQINGILKNIQKIKEEKKNEKENSN